MPITKLRVTVCLAFVLARGCLATPSLNAAPIDAAPTPQPLAPYPPGLSMPWRSIALAPETTAAAQQALRSNAREVAASWLASTQSLTDFLGPKHPTTRNNRLITDRITVGSRTGGDRSWSLEPSWCALMDRYLFFITVADTQLNTLLASQHLATPRAVWDKLDTNGQNAFLRQHLLPLAGATLAQAASRSTATKDALHVGLALARAASRDDEGSSLCLSQLLEEQLAANYTVARTLGTDHQSLLNDLLSRPATPRRPTRILVLNWDHHPASPFQRTLPVQLMVRGSLVESVFGKHIPISYESAWTCRDSSGPSVSCVGDDSLAKLLSAERRSLLLSDSPLVAKRDRAWVYLDRGRAWGLKMNDRLVADVGGQAVKGHVVHFFGPEENLTSPRGFPIREGAVLYIRLGQRLPQVGTLFQPDPRTFPTPLPLPANGGNAASSSP